MQAFRTKKGSETVSIAGVGALEADGRSAIALEEAAIVMAELQEKDAEGALVLDKKGYPKPLTGQELIKAAKEYAEAHGLEVASVAKDDVTEDASDDLLAESKLRWEQTYKNLVPVNDNPEAMAGADQAAAAASAVNPDHVKEG